MTSFQDVKDGLKAELELHSGRSLVKLGFIALNAMMRARLTCHTWSMTPWQSWMRSIKYSGLDDQAAVTKLLLHIHSYLLDMDVNLIDVSMIGPESSYQQCACTLRRQLDALKDGSTRSRPKDPEPEEPDLQDIAIDANNRFSILFESHGASEDHTFYLDDDVEIRPQERPSLEDRRYKTQAESNATRKKMGYPPKGEASTDSARYSEIQSKAAGSEVVQVIIHKVYRPLFRWRRDFLIPFREGKMKKEDLTIVPLTLLGVYEQMFREYDSPELVMKFPLSGCLDGVPRPWDGLPLRESRQTCYQVVEDLAK